MTLHDELKRDERRRAIRNTVAIILVYLLGLLMGYAAGLSKGQFETMKATGAIPIEMTYQQWLNPK